MASRNARSSATNYVRQVKGKGLYWDEEEKTDAMLLGALQGMADRDAARSAQDMADEIRRKYSKSATPRVTHKYAK